MRVLNHSNFQLDETNWGTGSTEDISVLFDDIINCFNANLDPSLINVRNIIIAQARYFDPPFSTPIIINIAGQEFISINACDNYWSQYSYQFSHEYCHYIINRQSGILRVSWFEESLCELAPIINLYTMSIKWVTNPPYPQWKDYSVALKDYADGLLAECPKIEDFKSWFNINLEFLYQDRYLRDKNKVIVRALYSLFQMYPCAWQCVQYLNQIKEHDNLSFEEYLNLWENLVPEQYNFIVREIKSIFY